MSELIKLTAKFIKQNRTSLGCDTLGKFIENVKTERFQQFLEEGDVEIDNGVVHIREEAMQRIQHSTDAKKAIREKEKRIRQEKKAVVDAEKEAKRQEREAKKTEREKAKAEREAIREAVKSAREAKSIEIAQKKADREAKKTEREKTKAEREKAKIEREKAKVAKDQDLSGRTVVFTDGACSNNGKPKARAGLGVWWGPDHEWNTSERVTGSQTNQRAEVSAASVAIAQAAKNGIERLLIKTDSMYVINCIKKWIPKWKENGWKKSNGQDVLHRDLFEEILENLGEVDVHLSFVKGHSGVEGNEGADALAVAGAHKD